MSKAVSKTYPSSLELLSRIDVSVKEGKTIGVYGFSMVGKSILSTIIARDFAGENGNAIVFGTENHYADEDYRNMVSKFLPKNHFINYCNNLETLYKYMYIVKKKSFEGKVVLILDSLSFIAIRETARWNMQGVSEPRVIAARVIPQLYTVAAAFKDLVVEKRALGIMIMHAGTTAGTGKFRGITDLRPSMAGRVAHSLDYLILMEAEGASLDSPRKLTLVMSRLSPESEGKSIKFRFAGDRVDIIEEEKKEKGGE